MYGGFGAGDSPVSQRILYVVRYFPTLTETFVHDEARALATEGMPVELAAFGSRADPGTEALGLPVFRQPHRWEWLPWLPALLLEWFRQPAWVSRRILWLSALLRERKITRVQVHFGGEAAAWAAAACARVGVPYGLTIHAVDLFRPRPDLRALMAGARPLLTISCWNQRWIAEHHGLEATLLPCVVEADEFGRDTPSEPPMVLAAGRWVQKKGFETLLKAWKGLDRRAELHLVSDAPVGTGGEGVVVHGLLPRRELREMMRRATVFVLPCQPADNGDMDGIPVVILEAMASELPVISTDVSGIPEVLDPTVGWVVPPADVERLREALREVLDQPQEARQRGQLARQRLFIQGRTRSQQQARLRALFA